VGEPRGPAHQRLHLRHQRVRVSGLDMTDHPIERGLEPLVRKWLQQIVDGVRLEGAERVLVVRGDEDHRGSGAWVALGGERRRDRKAVHLRHLHIQEHQVDRGAGENGLPDVFDGFGAGRAATGQLDPGVAGEQAAHPLPARLLVVHDQGTNQGHRQWLRSDSTSATGRAGSMIRTSTPPPATGSIRSVAAAP
jgi:hypothetical protein